MILRFIVGFAALTLTAMGLRAQDMRWLTLRDGLPGMSVTTLCEDPSGKMWIGTSNGVALYNGVTLRSYALPRQTDGQPSFCHELAVDDEGNVWAATKSGIYRLRRYESSFQRVAPEVDLTECILVAGDTVYVGGRTGLYAIDRHDRLTALQLSDDGPQENSSVRCLRLQGDWLWLTLRHRLLAIDRRTGQHRYFPLNQPSGLSRFDIVGDSLYVGTKSNGLYAMSTATGQWRRVEAVSNVVNDVHAVGDGRLCVASDGSGAYLLNARTSRVELTFSNADGLPTDAVYTYLRTADGTDWVGMYQSGLTVTGSAYPVFRPYECGAFSTRGMKVTATLSDGPTRLIAVRGGFWVVDTETCDARYIDTSRENMLHIMGFCRYGDAYYVGSFDGGLLRFDTGSHRLSRIPDCQQLTWASVMDMKVSPDGQLWAVTGEGLFIINDDADGPKVLKNYTEKNSKLPLSVHSLLFDRMGNAWIGSTSNMCIFLRREREIKVDGFPNGFFNDVPRLIFTSLGDSIYARSPMSVYRTDALMTDFSEVTLPEGLLGEKCMDFMADADGVRYVSTEKGLFRVDSRRGTLLQLTHGWGLQGDIVSTGTLGMDDRYIWIATNEGLMVADKRHFASDSLAAMHIPIEADYVITGQTQLAPNELLEANDRRELWVGWNIVARKLVVQPAIVDYAQHQGDIYEWRTDEADQWQRGNVGQPIELTGLMPGRHTLEMRLSGLEGSTVGYTVYVLPTWLFYLEAALVVISLALLLWWRSWRRRTKLLLQEHVETENALIEEMKTAPEEKYSKSRVKDEELARLFAQVEDYVKEKKPYLNNDSKMSDIAVALGVSPSMLSQVFTLYVKEPYYDYINKYRLEEFKQLIRDGRHKQFTITALSEQCGFKKTSFFATFRKVEGTTPTEWIQRNEK